MAKSATARMEASRKVTKRVVSRELGYVGILTRLWPSHLAPRAKPDEQGWSLVVCVHSPAGQLAWALSIEEAHAYFPHLETSANDWDGHTTAEKHERIASLVASHLK